MSNINPHPVFEPTPGKPRAAPAHFPYRHDSMAVVMAGEKRQADRDARALAAAHLCRVCTGRSPEWKVGRCVCGNTGLASPPASG